MRFHRRRLCDVGIYALVSILFSILTFLTVSSNPDTFQPRSLRILFLTCIVASWPFNLISTISTLWVFVTDTSRNPEVRFLTISSPLLFPAIVGIFCGLAGSCLLVLAQSTWVWVASQVGILWLLSLIVLGLASLVVMSTYLLGLFFLAARIRWCSESDLDTPSAHKREATVLQIDEDAESPQKTVATIPTQDSELIF